MDDEDHYWYLGKSNNLDEWTSPMKESYCYILECADGTFYTGWTHDPTERLKMHNAGRGARYTRNRLPVTLVYIEYHADRSAAMRREKYIKNLPRSKKLLLIERTEK